MNDARAGRRSLARARVLCALCVSTLAFCASARADVLLLKDGRRIEGKITSADAQEVRIQTRLSELVFARAQVASIERTATLPEQFAQRFAAARSAQEFFELGQWAQKNTLLAEARRCMTRTLELDAQHAQAHEYFGHVRYKDEWLTPKQRDARLAQDEERAQLALGLVRHEGRWVTPAERDKLAQGLVQVDGEWLTLAESKQRQGLEEFEGRWLPRAEVQARTDLARIAAEVQVELASAVSEDALVAGPVSAELLASIQAGLHKGRAWFDRAYGAPQGLALFGGRLPQFYVWRADAPYLATIGPLATRTTTLPEGWAPAVRDADGFVWWDPAPLSSVRARQRSDADLAAHCQHHLGHVLVNRLGYDGKLLPPWYDEALACLLELAIDGEVRVFCHSATSTVPTRPSTGDPRDARGPRPTTRVGATPAATGADLDRESFADGTWRAALARSIQAGTAATILRLAGLELAELEPADLAAGVAILEWLASRQDGALRSFHERLRAAAPPPPARVQPSATERRACYEQALRAAIGSSVEDADQAWRQWFLNR